MPGFSKEAVVTKCAKQEIFGGGTMTTRRGFGLAAFGAFCLCGFADAGGADVVEYRYYVPGTLAAPVVSSYYVPAAPVVAAAPAAYYVDPAATVVPGTGSVSYYVAPTVAYYVPPIVTQPTPVAYYVPAAPVAYYVAPPTVSYYVAPAVVPAVRYYVAPARAVQSVDTVTGTIGYYVPTTWTTVAPVIQYAAPPPAVTSFYYLF
jgi:hypothetical protein